MVRVDRHLRHVDHNTERTRAQTRTTMSGS
jgi:hypothetical protein